MNHFENLWEEAEKELESETNISNISELINELMGKLSALDALCKMKNMPEEDLKRLKENTIGKILLNFTQISMKENINTYKALKNALNDKKIEHLEKKYQ